jgi:hypothetical protein
MVEALGWVKYRTQKMRSPAPSANEREPGPTGFNEEYMTVSKTY